LEIERVVLSWPAQEGREAALANKQLQLGQIEERLDRLTDALIDRLINEETFAQKKQAMMVERERLYEEIAAINDRISNEGALRRFLELAKNLAQLYVSATAREKRQIVELTTSNREVTGKNVELVAQTWLRTLQDWAASPTGDPYRSTSRTFKKEAVEKLIEASASKEAIALAEFVQTSKGKNSGTEHTLAWQTGMGMSHSDLECS
jgi:site-specific DNA recombinase